MGTRVAKGRRAPVILATSTCNTLHTQLAESAADLRSFGLRFGRAGGLLTAAGAAAIGSGATGRFIGKRVYVSLTGSEWEVCGKKVLT